MASARNQRWPGMSSAKSKKPDLMPAIYRQESSNFHVHKFEILAWRDGSQA
jgi:hypothetical protein